MALLPAKVTICDASGNALAVLPLTMGNPTSVTRGSLATSTARARLSASTTAYTGGIDIWNTDTANSIAIGGSGVTYAAGAGVLILGPGQGYHEPSGNLSALYAVASAGTPILSWAASTL